MLKIKKPNYFLLGLFLITILYLVTSCTPTEDYRTYYSATGCCSVTPLTKTDSIVVLQYNIGDYTETDTIPRELEFKKRKEFLNFCNSHH